MENSDTILTRIIKALSPHNWYHLGITWGNGITVYINAYKLSNKNMRRLFPNWNPNGTITCWAKNNDKQIYVDNTSIFNKIIKNIKKFFNKGRR